MGSMLLVGMSINRIITLEAAVLGSSAQVEPKANIGEILGEMQAMNGEKGERGEKGDVGSTGPQGEKGKLPEGDWEEYCLYPKNEAGFRTEGALIRKSSGNCKSSWRIVKLWEK